MTRRIITGKLPDEAAQLELINYLGLAVFSRNVYSDPYSCWFGGLTATVWDGVDYTEEKRVKGGDIHILRRYRTPRRGQLYLRLKRPS